MSPRIFLIRHGETEWSLSGQHTGRTDIPLTPNGERQARLLGSALRTTTFTHVLTSPRRRARTTCELAGLGAIANTEPDLAEWDYGEYEGLRSADIKQHDANWNIFLDGCPGGEMPAQIAARADRLLARLRELDGAIALFSHGHFSRVLALRWIGQPVAVAQYFELGPAALSTLGHAAHHPEIAVIEQWNNSAHLAQG